METRGPVTAAAEGRRGSAGPRRNELQRRANPSSAALRSFGEFCCDAAASSSSSSSSSTTSASARALSPLARFVLSAIQRNGFRWGPAVVDALSTLRRIPSPLLSELLRCPLLPPRVSSPLFVHASRLPSFRPSYGVFNSLLLSLLRHSPASADLVPDLMARHGLPPTLVQLRILLRAHALARRPLRLHRLYNRMLRPPFLLAPTPSLLHLALRALVSSSRPDLALHLHSLSPSPSALSLLILARGLCLHPDLALPHTLPSLLARLRLLLPPDVFAYTAMLRAAARARSPSLLLLLHAESLRDRVPLDPMAYTTLISALCACGPAHLDRAHSLLLEMTSRSLLPDRPVYAALIAGFSASGDLARACELFASMVARGYRADLSIYESLIAGLCSAGMHGKAKTLFRAALQEGLVPSACPLLVSYAKENNIQSFFALLDRFRELVGVERATECIVAFFASELGESTAWITGILEGLRVGGYSNVAVCDAAIGFFHRMEMHDRAITLFGEMMASDGSSWGVGPECSTYSSIIPCFVESGDVKGACLHYMTMKQMLWIPGLEAYRSLVKGLCSIGQISAAITVVKDCLGNVESGPREFKYALTVIDACRSKDPAKVMGVVKEMMDELSCPPEEVIYCAVIYGFCKYASMQDARKVFSELRDRGVLTELKLIRYEDILKEHLLRTTARLVISGLKFFGLESKMKVSSPLEYTR